MSSLFSGSYVALVTPFKDGSVDFKTLEDLVGFHIKNGTSGLVPCGTTGESATLSYEEHEEVIKVVVRVAKKRIPVIAGTGSNNTKEAIAMTQSAERDGADGSLQISPYYNRPTQKGLYEHFKSVAQSVKFPIMLYNIASRTGVNIEPETVAKLSEVKNIQAIKEASGSLDQMSRIIVLCGNRIKLMSGDDSLTLPILSIGGTGIVSVIANIVPRDVSDMVSAFEKGDIKKAQEGHYKLLPLVKAMFIETNPIPVKTAMGLLGMCSQELRLPMVPMEETNLEKLKKALRDYGLLK